MAQGVITLAGTVKKLIDRSVVDEPQQDISPRHVNFTSVEYPYSKILPKQMRSLSQWISIWCLVMVAVAFGAIAIICFIGLATRGGSTSSSVILAGAGVVFLGISTGSIATARSAWKGGWD